MDDARVDRQQLKFYPLADREDRVFVDQDFVDPKSTPKPLGEIGQRILDETIARLRRARENDRPRMLTFGAHAIKNGLAPVMIELLESGWVTHLATNGAGIIHDWEFAYQGHSSEHVAANVDRGAFGMWHETGLYLNLAINIGAYRGLGYGAAVGAMVAEEGLPVPSQAALRNAITAGLAVNNTEQIAAAADLMTVLSSRDIAPGWLPIPHPHKNIGLQAAAYRLGVPFTSHPMFGHDIIYLHPANHGAAIGRCAERDFLSFAESVTRLDGGVYMSVGSAVMSPMVFEKSMSMAQNLAQQRGTRLDDHFMVIVDLQESHWDWTRGEPPEEHPDYYLRFNKSFNRMGGHLRYICADNRDFLLSLHAGLSGA